MPKIQLDAYLFFTGNCRDAMEFYKEVFGGKLNVQTYDEVPGEKPANSKGKIMHALLSGGDIRLMASDSTRKEKFGRSFISLSLSGSDDKKLRTIFDKLAKGGKIDEPLKKQFWGDVFGALTDKFGVEWMVNVNEKKE